VLGQVTLFRNEGGFSEDETFLGDLLVANLELERELLLLRGILFEQVSF